MSYRIHFISDNSNLWTKPSPGRLNKSNKASFVATNGFGFEDWNFNTSLANEGLLLGHTTARIAQKDQQDVLNIIWAVSINGNPFAVGAYLNAKHVNGKEPSNQHLEHITADIFDFAQEYPNDISDEYLSLSFDEIKAELSNDSRNFKILVNVENILAFKNKIAIPEEIINYGSYRTVNSYQISEIDFKSIIESTDKCPIHASHPDDNDFEEGTAKLSVHMKRERSAELVNRFKKSLSDFSCSICGFDFESAYGDLGRKFIECHHVKPVSQMKPGEKTALKDLAAVCSNCHRMLHRVPSPVITPAQLRDKLKGR